MNVRFREGALRSLEALQVRNFRLYWTSQVLSNIGTWFQILAQSLVVLDLTHKASALGVVTALQFLPLLLFGAQAGVLADRFNPRVLLTLTSAVAGVLALILGVVAGSGHLTLLWVYALALGLGVVQAIDRPAGQAFLFEMVGPERLSSAVGLNTVINSGSRLLGPALGGIVYATMGASTCFLINGFSYGLVIAALAMMTSRDLRHRIAASSARGKLREGLRYARGNPEIRTALIVNVVVGLLAFNFLVVVTAMARFTFHGGAGAVGASHAVNAIGSVLGGVAVGAFRSPGRRHLTVALFVMGGAILIESFMPTFVMFLVFAPAFGGAVALYNGTVQALIQNASDPAMLGRMMSLFTLGQMGMTPIGGLLSGWVIDRWSPRVGLAMGGIASVVCACALIGTGRRTTRSAADTLLARDTVG